MEKLLEVADRVHRWRFVTGERRAELILLLDDLRAEAQNNRDALFALERTATAHMLAATPEEKARTDALVMEGIEVARKALGTDA